MMAEVAGGAQGSVVMAALRGGVRQFSFRVPDASQRAAVRRRAGTQIGAEFADTWVPALRGSVSRCSASGTRERSEWSYLSSRPSSNGSSPPTRFFFFERCQTTPGKPFSGTSGSPV